jgi:hypothetical protein
LVLLRSTPRDTALPRRNSACERRVAREWIPEAFWAQIAEHNRTCWIAAALSLGCAGVAWTIAAVIYAGIVLLFGGLGPVDALKLPQWFFPVGLCGFVVLLAIAMIDRHYGRFKPVSDRPIIGRHLIGELLLLPARATLLIWDHLDARIVLSRAERETAWMLMQTISKMKRADTSLLAREFPDSARLSKMLTALQLAGWDRSLSR